MPVFQEILYPPNLPGLAFNVVRRPKGLTSVQTSITGREGRLGYWTYPLYEWDLTYSVLRDFKPCDASTIPSELKRLEGFFLAVQGSLQGFYFNDPDDNHVTGQVIGTGDGVTASFLIVRTYGDASYGVTVTEPIGSLFDPGGSENVFYLNGIPQTLGTNYTITGDPGAKYVTWAGPPASGVVISADLFFNFFVRFKDDTLDFEKFSGPPGAGFWEVKKLTLVSMRSQPAAPAAPPPPPPPTPPPPPPPSTQIGWQITVTITSEYSSTEPWTATFSDPALGTLSISPVLPSGPFGVFFWSAGLIVFNIDDTMISFDQTPYLGLQTVTQVGDSGPLGGGYIIVKQVPWTGNTTVSVTIPSQFGYATISPWSG